MVWDRLGGVSNVGFCSMGFRRLLTETAMFSGFDQSALLASFLLTSGLFFSSDGCLSNASVKESRNYALIAAVISGVITYGALIS